MPHDGPPQGSSSSGSPSSSSTITSRPDMRAATDAHLNALERWAVQATHAQFNAISGAIGGLTSGIVTCPLDVIKTKLQAQGGFAKTHKAHDRLYKGMMGTAKIIWRDEGLRGMYRGLGPIIMGYLPTWAVWFTVYNKSKEALAQQYHNGPLVNLVSSVVAGGSSTIVTNPIWVIKTRLMSQTGHHSRAAFSLLPKGSNTPTSRPTLHAPWHYRSTFDAARKMYTTEGILSFYSGLSPALLGLSHVAVQFPTYEFLKIRFTGRGMGESAPESQESPGEWLGVLSASVLSKVLASSATYPHEVIRTRLQTQRRPVPGQEFLEGIGGVPVANGGSGPDLASKVPSQVMPPVRHEALRYKGIIRTFRIILREEGWHAFYAGMGTNMMRAVPAATVTMLTYEFIMRELTQIQMTNLHKLESGGMVE